MKKRNVAEVAEALTNGLGQSLSIQNPRLFTQLLRFLADGRPVSFEQIATPLHISRNDVQDLGSALDMWHLLHVLDGLESEHRGYNMKNAELFGNGQSKPEVLKEGKK